MITLDNSVWSFTLVCCSNNLRYYIDPYCKASFIKVPNIIFMYTMLLNSFTYSLKL
jgi:hypothetical protein